MQEKNLKADSKKKICKRLRSLYTRNWFLDWGKKMKKKGFTLVEMLIVIFVLSTGIILIIKGMSESHRYLSETAQRTVALNLAKEGIEAVYNLRNSNWRRWSDKKNECWLSVWEECWEYSEELTNSQMRILGLNDGDICTYDYNARTYGPIKVWTPQLFIHIDWEIPEWKWNDKDARFKELPLNRQPKYAEEYKLIYYRGKRIPRWSIDAHERWNYFRWNSSQPPRWEWTNYCPFEYITQANTSLWEYSRVITIHGLFDKTTGQKLTCTNTANSPCKSSSPKELRFCSTVFYTKPYQGVVNVCSIMTNFEQ